MTTTKTKTEPIAPEQPAISALGAVPGSRRFPDLSESPVSCNSWVVTKDGHTFETWDNAVARGAFDAGATVETAYDHLVALNENTKADP